MVRNGVYTFKGNDIDFSFYTDLDVVDKVKFVNTVTDYIVDKNYNSIIRDIMFDFEIVDIFTDVDLTEIRESNNSLCMIEEFLAETKVVDIVKKNMVDGLLRSLNKAVDDNISYRTGVFRNSLSESLSNLMITLNNKINEIDTDSLMEAAQKLNDMTGDLSADSIMKAYINSGIYKKENKESQRNRCNQQDIIKNIFKSKK